MSVAQVMNEKQLQAAVVEMARLFGWLVYHTYDSRKSQAGFPDLCMTNGDRIIFAELKSDKGVLSSAQEHWVNMLTVTRRVQMFVWRPEHWANGAIEDALR